MIAQMSAVDPDIGVHISSFEIQFEVFVFLRGGDEDVFAIPSDAPFRKSTVDARHGIG